MTFATASVPNEPWRRVTRAEPCPVCGKDSWCTVAPDGSTARCKRQRSDEASAGEDGEAWLHRLSGVLARATPVIAAPRHDEKWRAMAERFQQAATDEHVTTFARVLHVEHIALRELGVGWNGADWTFPMYAADGSVCGIRRRTRAGNKLAMKGCRLGIIRREQPDDGLLLVCEGESDTATAISLGFDAIGVPGAGQCIDIVAVYARNRDVVVMSDADGTGAEAAEKTAAVLRSSATSVRVVLPAPPHKDLRAWVISGAKREDVDAAIAAAPLVEASGADSEPAPEEAEPPSPIIERWSAIASLDEKPPAARWVLRDPMRNGEPAAPGHGDGVLRRGRVGQLVAGGGMGKTLALIDLSLAVATGGKWFGHYPVDDAAGKVLLLLAEEDREEVQRRLYYASRHLTDAQRREAEARIVQLPLMGRRCGLLTLGKAGVYTPTREYIDLLRRLDDGAGADGWALVVLDPLSRVAGLPLDVNNDHATAVVQCFETLTEVTGNPAVMAAVHASKASRRPGERVEARGASGLTDGVRWEANLSRHGGRLYFHISKTNYGRFMEEPGLQLEQGEYGVLRAVSTAAKSDQLVQRAQDQRLAVIDALRALGGRTTSIRTVTKRCAGKPADLCAAFREAVDAGAILERKVRGQRIWNLPNAPSEGASAGGVCTPHTPQAPPPPARGAGDEGGAAGGKEGAAPHHAPCTEDVDDGLLPNGKRKARRRGGAA